MNYCHQLHKLLSNPMRYRFPFDHGTIPTSGVYVLFEEDELGHDGQRIVRAGSHTGHAKLVVRLREHFIAENKDRSIFRKNIGRALLNRREDQFLSEWEIDLTSRKNRDLYAHQIDSCRLQTVEREVTDYIRKHFSFIIIHINDKDERLYFEKRIIATVSGCPSCNPSFGWLGRSSPIDKIRKSGLWQVNHLYGENMTDQDIETLADIVKRG